MRKSAMPVYLLVDNGSKQAEAILRLRQLAEGLGRHAGERVHPISLQHADAIPAEALGGTPAQTLGAFLAGQLREGEREFVALPLFFGESRALTAFIPEQLASLRTQYPDLHFRLAPVTYPLPEGDPRLARIVHDHVRAARPVEGAKVVLVDHGSPSPRITEVRQAIAADLERDHGLVVEQAVMERREGPEYDFNGPLLEQWLVTQAEQGVRQVIIAMLFFLPGRHAGAGGDVDAICRGVIERYPHLSYTITPLVGEHPTLLELLADRMRQAAR
jgi:sirohydrochlorin ferrochelatase